LSGSELVLAQIATIDPYLQQAGTACAINELQTRRHAITLIAPAIPRIALMEAVRVWRERGILSADPVQDAVAAVSIGIVDGKILLDLCYEEDSKADVDMNFVMTGTGKFIEVQGTAESAPFTKKQMERMAEIAHQGIKELLQAQKKVIASFSKVIST